MSRFILLVIGFVALLHLSPEFRREVYKFKNDTTAKAASYCECEFKVEFIAGVNAGPIEAEGSIDTNGDKAIKLGFKQEGIYRNVGFNRAFEMSYDGTLKTERSTSINVGAMEFKGVYESNKLTKYEIEASLPLKRGDFGGKLGMNVSIQKKPKKTILLHDIIVQNQKQRILNQQLQEIIKRNSSQSNLKPIVIQTVDNKLPNLSMKDWQKIIKETQKRYK